MQNPIIEFNLYPGEIAKIITQNEVLNVKPHSYAVTTLGRVFSLIKRGNVDIPHERKPRVSNTGELYLNLATIDGGSKTEKIHKLVMKAFNPRSDMLNQNLRIKFLDGNRKNPELSNLQWREDSWWEDADRLGNPEDIQKFLQPGEYYMEITNDIVPSVKPYYFVTNFGRVFSIAGGHNKPLIEMSPYRDKAGYMHINFYLEDGSMDRQLLHRVVLATFKPIDDWKSKDVNHIYGKKELNFVNFPIRIIPSNEIILVDSIEWCTAMENNIHALKMGLRKRTDEKSIIEAKKLLNEGHRIIDVANLLNLSFDIVYTIKHNMRYLYILENMEE